MWADAVEFGSKDDTDSFTKVFEVSNVNGVQRLGFKSSAFPDNIVDSRSLLPGADVERIIANADTITRTASQWYNSGSGNTVMTATVAVLDDEALEMTFRGVFTMSLASWNQSNTNIIRGTIKCYVNDVQVDATVDWGATPGWSGAWFQTVNNMIVAIPFMAEEMVAGDAVVRIEFALNSAASPESQTFSIINPRLYIHKIKRPLITFISDTPVATDAVYVDTYITGNGSPAELGKFYGVAIGDADEDRMLGIFAGWMSGTEFSPVLSVDGKAATLVCDVNAPTQRRLNLYSIPKTTGTTADIEVTLPSDATDCFVAVINMTVNSVARLTQNDSFGGANAEMNFAAYADAVGIVAAYTDTGASGISLSSTTGTVTELVDELNTGGDGRLAVYKIEYAVSGGASVTATGTGATQHNIAGGVWR